MPQNSYAEIVGRLLGLTESPYRLAYMYIEFENVADPDDAVTVPAEDKTAGVGYYQDLAAPRDFLRVPVQGAPSLALDDGFDGAAFNRLTFYALSSGSAGVHGLPFSNAANSKIYGRALVAAPAPDDWSRDLLYCREYLAAADQMVKPASGEVGVPLTIRLPND